MDTSIRFYNTNSSLRSAGDTERKNRPTSPLTVDEASYTETADVGEEVVDTHPQLSVSAPQEQVQKVDVADFEAIFLRFQGPITNFIYHLIGNREQAYDLAQDVFVKAYKALLGGTVVQPGALSAWLYRIAANTTTDTLRRRRLIAWLPLSLFNEDRGIGAGILSDSGGAVSDGFSNSEDDASSNGRASNISSMYERGGYDGGRFESRVADREIVERVFKQLPPKYAVCLWLYENDGLSCAEIAEILNISASAVKMRLMRARERFINLYKQEVSEA
ncbi:MAG: RNA polymerase sigma factor [Ktedonobacteraceae bacterium]